MFDRVQHTQKLDRTAFIAYFLGAVVPLAALCLVVQRFVLPSLRDVAAAFNRRPDLFRLSCPKRTC